MRRLLARVAHRYGYPESAAPTCGRRWLQVGPWVVGSLAAHEADLDRWDAARRADAAALAALTPAERADLDRAREERARDYWQEVFPRD